MTTANENGTPKALDNQGVKPEDLNQGQTVSGAPKPPAAPSNSPPPPAPKKDDDGKDEVHGEGTKPDANKPDEKKPDDKPTDDSWKQDYIKMEDPVANSVIDLLKESQVSVVEANAIFEKALASGDIKDVNWDVLRARLGDAKFTLAKAGIEAYYNGKHQANMQSVAAAHEVMGGAENWQTVAAWVRATEKADPARKAEFDEIRKGLDAGGRLAKYAAQDLRKMYESDKNNNGLGTSKIVQGTSTAPTGAAPLTRAEYLKEMKAANDRNAKPTEIAALRARRQAGMQAGI
ncbi:head scaffolding protein [Nostoc phage NMeng1]|nr:head scaffolding protein [Nostoc phage NMeng1]